MARIYKYKRLEWKFSRLHYWLCRLWRWVIPELELVRVAQMISIGCEIAQACKSASADPNTRRQMNLETRVTLASTSRFLATDFLQVGILAPLGDGLRDSFQDMNH